MLLLYRPGPSANLEVRAAARALSPEEHAIFGLIDADSRLHISGTLDPDDVKLIVNLPAQIAELKDLFIALPCKRAAVINSELLDNPVIRAVRNAGVPVFSNGSGL